MSRFEYTIEKMRITENRPILANVRIVHVLDWDIVSESSSGVFTYELTVVLEKEASG